MPKKVISSISILISLIGICLIGSCELRERTDLPKGIKVILDTDMGSDCDDAGAMALLHKYADLGKGGK